mmetsp:Transcript_24301/g.96365  ORF Transcript_24301/g.96365 Transcript_24301/m.96365 type:complete len:236 (-) Transcript_24301:1764-2471(-)
MPAPSDAASARARSSACVRASVATPSVGTGGRDAVAVPKCAASSLAFSSGVKSLVRSDESAAIAFCVDAPPAGPPNAAASTLDPPAGGLAVGAAVGAAAGAAAPLPGVVVVSAAVTTPGCCCSATTICDEAWSSSGAASSSSSNLVVSCRPSSSSNCFFCARAIFCSSVNSSSSNLKPRFPTKPDFAHLACPAKALSRNALESSSSGLGTSRFACVSALTRIGAYGSSLAGSTNV